MAPVNYKRCSLPVRCQTVCSHV